MTPTQKMKVRPLHVLACLALLLVGGGAYVSASPYLAFGALRRAASRGDLAEVARHVDLDALRGSASSAIAIRASDRARDLAGATVADVVASVTKRVAQPAVDILVTPESIASRLRAEAGDGAVGVSTSGSYEALDRFRLHVTRRDVATAGMTVVMCRDGVAHWRVCELDAGTEGAR